MEHTLDIDVDMARRSIVGYLQEVQSRNGSKGLLLGLSGGIDSSVLAALAVAAVGSSSVHAAYLYDRDSEETVRRNAMLMARHLGLQLSVSDISDEIRNRKIYKPLIMRVLVLSGALNRAIQKSYTLICGETPFKSTL
ncbi:unnamed protein product, partial [marine sediment metagenome]